MTTAKKHVRRLALQVFLAAAAVAALTSCTAFSHRESLDRLDSGYQALLDAEDRAYSAVSGSGSIASLDAPVSLEPAPTLPEARIALALDAQRDLEAANGTFSDATEYDRVSALYRAALKGWNAGNAWENAPKETGVDPAMLGRIHQAGKNRCTALAKSASVPTRDCTVIGAAPELTVMEIAADNITDGQLQRLQEAPATEARLAILFKGVRDISEMLTASNDIPAGTKEGLERYFTRQRVVYLCHATKGMDELLKLADPNTPLGDTGFNATKWLGFSGSSGNTPQPLSDLELADLRSLLQRNGVERVEVAKGAYAQAVQQTAELVSESWSASNRRALSKFCKKLDRTTTGSR